LSPVSAQFGPKSGVLCGFFRSSDAPLLQIAHSDQVPAGEGQQEHVVDPLLASDLDLAHLANGLGPAKTFFDAFADFEATGVAAVAGRPAIQRRAAGSVGVASQMRGNTASTTGLDEVSGVIALVGSQRFTAFDGQSIQHFL